MLLFWFVVADVRAAPVCEALDEPELRTLVIDAQVAIDRGDIDHLDEIIAGVRARLPCLTFAPAPRLWADYLVAEAIYEFSRQGDWKAPMDAALRVRPAVDRGVGSGHPLAKYTPAETQAAPGPAVPEGVVVYVDGLRTGTLPPSKGRYLVQVQQEEWFASQVVTDAEVDSAWLTAPVERPPHWAAWVRVGLMGAGSQTQQSGNWESDYVRDGTHANMLGGGYGEVFVGYSRPSVGGYLELSTPLSATVQALGTTGTMDVVHWGEHHVVGTGLSLVGLDVWEGAKNDEAQNVYLLRYVNVMGQLRFGKKVTWDLHAHGGGRLNMTRFMGEGGATFGKRQVRWRVGARGHVTKARFVQEGTLCGQASCEHRVRTKMVGALATFGLVWGDY